jgi:hypothetical protein
MFGSSLFIFVVYGDSASLTLFIFITCTGVQYDCHIKLCSCRLIDD